MASPERKEPRFWRDVVVVAATIGAVALLGGELFDWN
jgi:hypothetical protein